MGTLAPISVGYTLGDWTLQEIGMTTGIVWTGDKGETCPYCTLSSIYFMIIPKTTGWDNVCTPS